MHLRNISRKLVTNTSMTELIWAVTKEDMERVQEHLSMKLVMMAEVSGCSTKVIDIRAFVAERVPE